MMSQATVRYSMFLPTPNDQRCVDITFRYPHPLHRCENCRYPQISVCRYISEHLRQWLQLLFTFTA